MAGSVEVIEGLLWQRCAAGDTVCPVSAVAPAAGRADLASPQSLRPEALFQKGHPAQGLFGFQVILRHSVLPFSSSVPPTSSRAPQAGQKKASGSFSLMPQWWQNTGYSFSQGAQSRHRSALMLNMAEDTYRPHWGIGQRPTVPPSPTRSPVPRPPYPPEWTWSRSTAHRKCRSRTERPAYRRDRR